LVKKNSMDWITNYEFNHMVLCSEINNFFNKGMKCLNKK
jgi:hypothetical protein